MDTRALAPVQCSWPQRATAGTCGQPRLVAAEKYMNRLHTCTLTGSHSHSVCKSQVAQGWYCTCTMFKETGYEPQNNIIMLPPTIVVLYMLCCCPVAIVTMFVLFTLDSPIS